MNKKPSPGDVIAGYVIKRQIGQGGLASVWEATKFETNTRFVIKLYPNDRKSRFLSKYVNYLREINEVLSRQKNSFVIPLIYVGETNDYTYQVYEYIERKTLADLIKLSAPLNPIEALSLLNQIARAVAALHECSIIHADIKPDNILLPETPEDGVLLIDLGMVNATDALDGILFFGTFQYMPPELIETSRKRMVSEQFHINYQPETVGKYIDIYALGVVALEMLSGRIRGPVPTTESQIYDIFKKKTPLIVNNNQDRVDKLINLIFRMLTVSAKNNGFTAKKVADLSESLISDFQTTETYIKPKDLLSEKMQKENISISAQFSDIAQQLVSIDEEMANVTRVLLAKNGTLASIPEFSQDERILEDVNITFNNALARVQSTWKLGIAMTIVSFTIILIMIVSAVILTLTTNESQWALIFGGASVPLIIGTLLWRPYDRVFRATILAQQIEMIHLRTIAGFSGTIDIEKRIEIFNEAINALDTLFLAHASNTIEKIKKK